MLGEENCQSHLKSTQRSEEIHIQIKTVLTTKMYEACSCFNGNLLCLVNYTGFLIPHIRGQKKKNKKKTWCVISI